jgi:hypothetical protein
LACPAATCASAKRTASSDSSMWLTVESMPEGRLGGHLAQIQASWTATCIGSAAAGLVSNPPEAPRSPKLTAQQRIERVDEDRRAARCTRISPHHRHHRITSRRDRFSVAIYPSPQPLSLRERGFVKRRSLPAPFSLREKGWG